MVARQPKEAPVNTIALNIDNAEREFRQLVARLGGISEADAERLSIRWRMKYLAGLNLWGNKIEVKDPAMLKPAAIKQALKELNERG